MPRKRLTLPNHAVTRDTKYKGVGEYVLPASAIQAFGSARPGATPRTGSHVSTLAAVQTKLDELNSAMETHDATDNESERT